MPETVRARRKKPPDSMDSVVRGARADAIDFLHETMDDTEEKTELRIKCATIIIGLETGEGPGAGRIEVVLGPCEEMAK